LEPARLAPLGITAVITAAGFREETYPAKTLNRSRRLRLMAKPMKITKLFSLLAAATLALNGAALAASVKDYQVTGAVLEVTDSMIAVEKGKNKERWEIARDSSTKSGADVKVGDRVTVHYTMTATSIESKAAKGAKKDEMKEAASPSPATSPKG
jgi:ribosomal 50S subunit-recycling heat shock protein